MESNALVFKVYEVYVEASLPLIDLLDDVYQNENLACCSPILSISCLFISQPVVNSTLDVVYNDPSKYLTHY